MLTSVIILTKNSEGKTNCNVIVQNLFWSCWYQWFFAIRIWETLWIRETGINQFLPGLYMYIHFLFEVLIILIQSEISSSFSPPSLWGFIYSQILTENKYLFHLQMSYRKEDEVTVEGQSGIVLPRTMFDTLRQGQRNSIDKITISVFRDPKLFSVSVPYYLNLKNYI